MFTSLAQFLSVFRAESVQTARVLAAVDDASLSQAIAEGHRTLGELAWHIVVSQREIVGKTGLRWDAADKRVRRPAGAATIHSRYVDGAKALAEAVERQWTDATLSETDSVYGMSWPRGQTLLIMVLHEVHHRGQLTVLMRQAGLAVPGVYGPARDESRG